MFVKRANHVVDHLHGLGPDRSSVPSTEQRAGGQNYSCCVCQVTSRNVTALNLAQPWRRPPAQCGKGTGWVMQHQDAKLIVTNHHVIANTDNIKVQFPISGSKEYTVKVVADCPAKDIAILKLIDKHADFERDTMRPLSLYIDTIPHEAPVQAVGFPLGQCGQKVTAGIFSGNQSMPGGKTFLQTSAPLNHGNSGGPLIYNNEVVGINSAIIPGANNVGYSIPIHTLQAVLNDYDAAADKTKPVFLNVPVVGVFWQNTTADLAKYIKNDGTEGVYCSWVLPGSMLAKQGVEAGMQITGITFNKFASYPGITKNGRAKIENNGELRVGWTDVPVHISSVFDRMQVNDKLVLHTKANGGPEKQLDISYTQTDPRAIKPVFKSDPNNQLKYCVVGGMVISQMMYNHVAVFMQVNPCLATFLDPIKLLEPKLIITHVFAGSKVADSKCFAPGMLLNQVNGRDVTTIDELHDALKNSTQQVSFRNSMHGFMVLDTKEMMAADKLLQSAEHFTSLASPPTLPTGQLLCKTAAKETEKDKGDLDALLNATNCADCGLELVGCGCGHPKCPDCKHWPCQCKRVEEIRYSNKDPKKDIRASPSEGYFKSYTAHHRSEAEISKTQEVKVIMGLSHLTDDEFLHYLDNVE